ncbi:MAG: ATP-binding cassette domain-containing protein, partial [Gemmatimonadetes bacterium]|nr:ATP-binding cassette domain-containing protein [Gemmatimonadota bacterium]
MDAGFAADSICKRFGRRPVLTSASLWAARGRVTALFGRNGSGKTTLLRIGAGLLAADSGAVHFAGGCWERPRLAQLA